MVGKIIEMWVKNAKYRILKWEMPNGYNLAGYCFGFFPGSFYSLGKDWVWKLHYHNLNRSVCSIQLLYVHVCVSFYLFYKIDHVV